MSKVQVSKVKVNETEMDYAKFGSGNKNLVIIPGLSIKSVISSANAVAKAYELFCEDFTVYVLDRRNNITKGLTINDMAEDIAKVMQELKISDAYIFGTSQGGMIAQLLAIEHPSLVKKLVLGSSASRLYDKSERLIKSWISLAEEGRIEELCEDFVKKLYSKPFADKYGALIVKMNSDATQSELERFIVLSSACIGFDIRNKLNKIKCPVLVLGAKEDEVLTDTASYETAELLGGELYMYDAPYGHAVYDEAEDYKERLMNFYMDNR